MTVLRFSFLIRYDGDKEDQTLKSHDVSTGGQLS